MFSLLRYGIWAVEINHFLLELLEIAFIFPPCLLLAKIRACSVVERGDIHACPYLTQHSNGVAPHCLIVRGLSGFIVQIGSHQLRCDQRRSTPSNG
jgi:hypothetical protein